MSNLQTELEKTRKRWLEAKAKGDQAMMALWLRVGLSLKERLAKESLVKITDAGEDLFERAKEIFGRN